MTANTPQSPPAAVRDALPAVLSGDVPVRWEWLAGGRTNAAWRGYRSSSDIVLKLYRGPAQNPLFPNLPDAEQRLLKHLDTTGLAPRYLGEVVTDTLTCNLYSHIPGTVWKTGAGNVARMMRKLHALDKPDGLRTCANGSAALFAQTDSILNACREASSLHALRPTCDVAPTPQEVLLHGDIVPGNLICNEVGLHLIDWQCPARGDPCEDIAIFLSPAMQHIYRGTALSEAETNAFLAAYDLPEITDRYRHLAPAYHWRMAAYCQWQLENGSPEYAAGLALERAALLSAS